MSMVVQHNIAAFNSNRLLGIVNGAQAKSTEKLSSGYRINRAADDASGLAISEKMRRQIRGLTQAAKNVQDGISLIQIADGAMNEIHDMLQRMNELAVKASNGTLQEEDRKYADAEVQKLKEEITANADKATFNEIKLFPTDGSSPQSAGSDNVIASQQFEITIGNNGAVVISASDPMQSAEVTSVSAASGWQNLARHVADELIPNAVNQVLNKFPSFRTATERQNINLSLEVSYVDGGGGTLAYAQVGYYVNGGAATPAMDSFMIKVDSSDFSDSTLGTSTMEMLESTLAHELTHTVMQNTMPNGMYSGFPAWFKEGTAQLSGGGFTTGWNEPLQNALMGSSPLSSETDTSKDGIIASYLRQSDRQINNSTNASAAGNVYGQGYLAAAYLGYVANVQNGGATAVNADNIASGMNRIFAELLSNGNNLDSAIATVTHNTFTSSSAVANALNTADGNAVDFVRKLVYNTGANGAGSVIASGGLTANGTNILDSTASGGSQYSIDSNVSTSVKKVALQVGSEADNVVDLKLFRMSAEALGLQGTNVLTQDSAQNALDDIQVAIQSVSAVRSYYGAAQNRLEHMYNNLNNVIENTTAAESLIRDTDMSEEMVRFANNNILAQASQAMLAQANQLNQGILSLLS